MKFVLPALVAVAATLSACKTTANRFDLYAPDKPQGPATTKLHHLNHESDQLFHKAGRDYSRDVVDKYEEQKAQGKQGSQTPLPAVPPPGIQAPVPPPPSTTPAPTLPAPVPTTVPAPAAPPAAGGDVPGLPATAPAGAAPAAATPTPAAPAIPGLPGQ